MNVVEKRVLAETVAWLSHRLRLGAPFWSDVLQVPIPLVPESSCADVVSRRREALSRQGVDVPTLRRGELGGRILRAFTANTLWPFEEVSRGIVCEQALPSWDTWLHVFPSRPDGFDLLSWIPDAWVADVQAAIDMDPELTMEWGTRKLLID